MKNKNIYKKIITATLTIIFIVSNVFVFVSKTNAAFNRQINYQGKLTNSSNVAVADGLYNVEFRLYTSPVSATTTALWTELDTVSNKIQVTNGLFSVMLGSTTPFTGVDFGQTLYLGVKIESDSEMTPRKVLGAVPAAFVADTLNGISSNQFVRNDIQNATTSSGTFLSFLQSGAGKIAEFFGAGSNSALSILSAGNIGIGTTTPGSKLSVGGDSYLAGSVTATGTLSILSTATSTIAGNMSIFGNGTIGTTGRLSSANNSLAIGKIGDNDDFINATGNGSLAFGYSQGSSGIAGVQATGDGALAFGKINGSGSAYLITSSGAGSFAGGYTSGSANITASGDGSFAFGNGVSATNTLSTAFGTGFTNNIANSFMVGYSTTPTFIVNGANVGIGTTTPAAKFAVGGNSYFGGNITATGTLNVSGATTLASSLNGLLWATNGVVTSTSTGGLGLLSSSTISSLTTNFVSKWNGSSFANSLVFDNGTNIGIGTTSPDKLLNVSANTNAVLAIDSSNSGVDLGSILFRNGNAWTNPASITSSWWSATNGVGGMVFTTPRDIAGRGFVFNSNSGVTKMFIDTTSGNVGIGTTSPSQRLTVSGGNILIDNNQAILFKDSVGGNVTGFKYDNNDNMFITGSTTASDLFILNSPSFVFKHNGAFGIGDSTPQNKLSVVGGANIYSASGNAFDVAAPSGGLLVEGNVGIGTTTPLNKLTIQGSGNTLATAAFNVTGADGGSHLFVRDDGNVGIGTTSPQGKLEVYNPGSGNADIYFSNGNTSWREVLAGVDSSFRIQNAGTNILNITTAGNVGIGTTSPESTLTVNSSGTDIAKFRRNGGGGSLIIDVNNVTSTSSTADVIFRALPDGTPFNSGGFAFRTSNAGSPVYAMTISSAGNIGIGTTTASQMLTVGNNNQFTVSSAGNVTTAGTLNVSGATTLASSLNGLLFGTNGVVSSLATSSLGLGTSFFQQGGNSFGTTATLGTNDAQSLAFETNGSAKMTILSAGNVGIGTTSPDSKLNIFTSVSTAPNLRLDTSSTDSYMSIKNSATGGRDFFIGSGSNGSTIPNSLYFYDATAATARMVIGSTGNVGIGTTTPSSRLTIQGTGNTSATTAFNVTGADGGSHLFVRDDGNIGVGTTSPAYKFVVSNGSAGLEFDPTGAQIPGGLGIQAYDRVTSAFKPFQLYGSSILLNGGNVGIGTTSPVTKLHVVGDIGIDGAQQIRFLNSDNSTNAFISSYVGSNGITIGENRGTYWTNMDVVNDKITFSTGSSGLNKSVFDTNGNLGIGTTTPSNKFEVAGNGYFAGNLTSGNITATGTLNVSGATTLASSLNGLLWATNGVVTSTSTGGLGLLSSSTISSLTTNYHPKWNGSSFVNSLIFDNGTNVGIGTTTPTFPLDVVGTSFAPLRLTSASQTSGIRMDSLNSNASNRNWFAGSNYLTYGDYSLTQSNSLGGDPINSGTSRFYISPTGNVGIGTTSPSTKFQVYTGNTANANEGITLVRGSGLDIFGLKHLSNGSGNYRAAITYNATEQMTFLSPAAGSYIGIGTSTPTNKLTIQGAGNTSATAAFNVTGADGGSHLFVRDDGNVGIGTTSPTDLFNIYSTGDMFASNSGLTISNNSTNGYAYVAYNRNRTNGLVGGAVERIQSNPANSTSAFEILTNTAIGPNSPATSTARAGMRLNSNSAGIDGAYMEVLRFTGGISADNLGVLEPQIRFTSIDSSGNNEIQYGKIGAMVTSSTTGAVAGDLTFYSRPNAGLTERMRITSTGNVGIGTTTPSNKLTIQGAGITSATSAFNVTGSDGNSHLFVRDDGNIGVGTTTPRVPLDVFGSAEVLGSISVKDTVANRITMSYDGTAHINTVASGGWSLEVNHSSAPPISFSLGNGGSLVERMRLTNAGNLGIGTTSPSSKLTVVGDGYFSGNLTSGNITATGTLNVSGATTLASSLNGLLFGTNGAVTSIATSSLGLANLTATNGTLTFSGPYNGSTARTVGLNLGNNNIWTQSQTFNVNISSSGGAVVISNSGATSNLGYLNIAGGANNILTGSATGDFMLSSSGGGLILSGTGTKSDFYIQHSNGNIGIGTTTPSNKLEVSGDGYFSGNLTSGNVTATGTLNVAGKTTLANASTTNLSVSGNAYFPNSSIWNNSGFIGLGTTSPAEMLTAYKSSSGQNVYLRLESGSFAQEVGIKLKNYTGGEWKIYENPSSLQNLTFNYGSSDLITFTGTGNVGIGTTTPISVFSVSGTSPTITLADNNLTNQFWQLRNSAIAGSNGFDIYDKTNSKSRLYINPTNGEVDIGTTTNVLSNGSRMFIYGGPNGANIDAMGDPTVTFGDQSTFEAEGADYGVNGNQNSIAIRYYGAGAFHAPIAGISTNNIAVLDFGTASSSVIRTINTTPIIFGINDIETMRLTINGLGIGTTSPSNKLEVAGNGYFSGNLTSGNITATGTLNVLGATTLASSLNGLLFGTNGAVTSIATSSLGLVNSVANSDSSLTISPNAGSVIASLNLSHSNAWTVNQSFDSNNSSFSGAISLKNNSATSNTIDMAISGAANQFITGSNQGDFVASANGKMLFSAGGTGNPTLSLNTNGNVGIGTTTPSSILTINNGTSANTALNILGNVNSYLESNIQNMNSGSSASSDYVATANNGNASSYYVNMGINSSGGGSAPFSTANDAYLYSSDTNLNIGALGSNSTIKFYTTGGTTPIERMRIDQNGRIAIGTSTPWAKLAIQQEFGLTTPLFSIASTTSSSFATSSLFTVLANGNVGIGSSTPSYMLTVAGNINNSGDALLGNAWYFSTSSTGVGYGSFRTNPATGNSIISAKTNSVYFNYDHGTGGELFCAGAGNCFTTISGNGKMYIGNGASVNGGGANFATFNNYLDVGGAVVIGQPYAGTSTAPVNGLLVAGNVGIGTTSPIGKLAIDNIADNNGIVFNAVGARTNAALTITNDGTAGGSANADKGLLINVSGGANIATMSALNIKNGTNPILWAGIAGNVGIGTTTPSELLTVAGNASFITPNSIFRFTTAGGVNYIQSGAVTTPGSAQDLSFGPYASTNSILMMKATGLIGIGTTTPIAKLSVSGAGTGIGKTFATYDSTGVERFTILDNGNVGIGTTSPNYRFNVSGTIALNGISTDMGLNLNYVPNPNTGSAVPIATGTGNIDNGTHYYWVSYTTAVGETSIYNLQAIGSPITVDASHKQVTVNIPTSNDPRVTGRKIYRSKANVTYGAGADWFLAAVADNTSTTYTDNIADASLTNQGTGYNRANTTSYGITMNGTKALTMDSHLTTVGLGSFTSLTTGGRSVGIGANAGVNVTTGSENTFIGGDNAGSALTTGSGNIAIGVYSMAGNQTGSNNTLVGNRAQGLITNANYSNVTGFGYNALYNLTVGAGSQSTAVGSYSGYTGGGGNNSFFGYYSGYYETGSNKLIVDNLDRGNEANSRSQSLIYGISSTTAANQILSLGGGGNVGIGTTTPISTLTVNGNSSIGNLYVSATGTNAFAIGNAGGTKARITSTGTGSFASGFVESNYDIYNNLITSSGKGSFATGFVTDASLGVDMRIVSSGAGSFAGGYVSGNATISSGNGSFAFGSGVSATGTLSTAFGANFSNNIDNSFMIGYGTVTPTFIVNGSNVGIGTTTPSNKFEVLGNGFFAGNITATGTLAIQGTGTSTIAGNLTMGSGQLFAVKNSFAFGQSGNASYPISASGNGSIAAGLTSGVSSGGIFATGNGSLALGAMAGSGGGTITSSNAGSIALGLAEGANITASGKGSFAIGYAFNTILSATGTASFAMGQSVSALADNAFALGSGFTNSTASTFKVGFSSTPTLTVNSTNVGIATTTPGSVLTVAGSTYLAGNATTTGTLFLSGLPLATTGNYLCIDTTTKQITSGTTCSLSSTRFKNNIRPMDMGLNTVLALNPVTFTFLPGYGDNGNTIQMGFVAEQANGIDPRLVPHDENGLPSGFNYANFTAVLTKAIQEQQIEINALKNATTTNTILAQDTYTISTSTIASTTSSILAESTSFIGSIANAVKNLLSSAGDWAIARLSATYVYSKKIEAETVSVSQGLEMKDQATGQVYCVVIKNGDWDKRVGTCADISQSTSTPLTAPVIINTFIPSVQNSTSTTTTTETATTTTTVASTTVPVTSTTTSDTNIVTSSAPITTTSTSTTSVSEPVIAPITTPVIAPVTPVPDTNSSMTPPATASEPTQAVSTPTAVESSPVAPVSEPAPAPAPVPVDITP